MASVNPTMFCQTEQLNSQITRIENNKPASTSPCPRDFHLPRTSVDSKLPPLKNLPNFVDDYDEAGFSLVGSQLSGFYAAPSATRRSSSRSSQKSSSSYDDSAVGAICCDVEEIGGLPSSVLSNALDEFLQEDTFADETSDLFAQNNLDMSDMLETQQHIQEQSQAVPETWQQHQREAQAYHDQAEQSLEHDHMPAHLGSLFGMTPTDMAAQQPSTLPCQPATQLDMSQANALADLLKQMSESSAPMQQQPAMQSFVSNSNAAVSAQTTWSDQFLAASIMSTASSFFPEDQSPVCEPSSAWVKADDEWIGPPAAESNQGEWAGPSMFASLSEVPALHAQQSNIGSSSSAVPRSIASHLDSSVLFPKAVAESLAVAQATSSTVNPSIFANTPSSTPLQTVQSSFGTPRSTSAAVFKEPLPPVSVSRGPSFDANSYGASVFPSPALSMSSDFSPSQRLEDTMASGSICPSSGKVSKPPADNADAPYLKMRKSRVKPGDPAEVRKYTAPSQTSRKTISSAIAKKHGISIDALGNPVRPDGVSDEQWEEMNPIRAQIQADIKREKNREAQRVSRQKRQEEMQGLQDNMMHWKQLAESLQAENEALRRSNASLHEQLNSATASVYRQPTRHATS
ncbi:hypothetical protein QFC20_001814 [Naganishia adeliensis]|uniref:Uncharacterized protein n=1 Tax=Naganishia adeliensis TaxID=92952 RepID=A0ACC2WRX7_9TREE|nr:hypothetical protein QFC20_001814 [Naganishia adeliensis]